MTSHADFELDARSGRFVAGAPWTAAGYAPEDLTASVDEWTWLVHPDDRAAVLEAMESQRRGSLSAHRIEYRVRAKGGTWRSLLVSTRVLSRDPDGAPIRIVGTMSDVTDARAFRDRRLAAARLAESCAPAAPRAPPMLALVGRVLILDDDALVGRSLGRLLQGAHEVTVLTSPAAAIAAVERGERWDAILCDLVMPELSGMDVEARLAACAPDLVPRVIYMTGGAFTDRAREFLAAGRPWLEKPVDAAVLRARVAEVVRRRRPERGR